MATRTHPTEDDWELYALGRLEEDQAARLEEHLLICAACQDRLSEIEAYVHAAREAARNLLREPPSRRQWLWSRMQGWLGNPVPVAAFAAAVLVLALLLPRLILKPSATPQALTVWLSATRGFQTPGMARAPASRPLRLAWDPTGLPPEVCCRLELVDATGRPLWSRQASPAEPVAAEGLPSGRYWLRLYESRPGGALLREFGLQVE